MVYIASEVNLKELIYFFIKKINFDNENLYLNVLFFWLKDDY